MIQPGAQHAARQADSHPFPGRHTILGAAMTWSVEAFLVAGQRVTTPAAIVRSISTQQAKARHPDCRRQSGGRPVVNGAHAIQCRRQPGRRNQQGSSACWGRRST
jgi:hypothetical protein